jgi:hypothetical protein
MSFKVTTATTDSAAGLPQLRQALERVAAIDEGRALVSYLKDHKYSLHLAPLDCAACLVPDQKILAVDASRSTEEMALFLAHEAFHAVQFGNCPDLYAFYVAAVCAGEMPGAPVPRPYDFLWAMNMMEMAAYAVQTDFVHQLAERGGDDGPLKELKRYMGPFADIYEDVRHRRTIGRIGLENRTFMKDDLAEDIDPGFARDYATAAVGYFWFWGSSGPGSPLNYNTHLVDAAHENGKARLTEQFNRAARGVNFRTWERTDIIRLGKGYTVNPLDVPGFDDITGAAYRNCMTRENARKLHAVERLFAAR